MAGLEDIASLTAISFCQRHCMHQQQACDVCARDAQTEANDPHQND
jgi:hypothetical protein